MSNPSERQSPTQSPPSRGQERDAIARLLQLAGPRPAVPEVVEERVRKRTRATWRRRLREQRRRRLLQGGVGLAAAAGLAMALLVIPEAEMPGAPVEPVQVATLTAATGVVSEIDGSEVARQRRHGEPLYSGTSIETAANARAALAMVGGSTLRLDLDTRIALVDERTLRLERGALYFDSAGDLLDSRALEVRTELGVVRDIGTQFEVRHDGGLKIRVREGRVELDREGDSHSAEAGVELRMSRSGDLSRQATPIFGPSWDWILDVSPTFTLEGHTLEAFLAWVSRETGREIEFTDERTAASASSVVLHGSIEGLRPDRALEAVLPTCGLERRIEGGILLIEAETR